MYDQKACMDGNIEWVNGFVNKKSPLKGAFFMVEVPIEEP